MLKRFIAACFGAWLAVSVSAQGDGDVCVFGDQTFVAGENLGDVFLTRCGTADEWPCFCNPLLPNLAECPYCGFATGDGAIYCAADGQNITFTDGSVSRACTCEIPDDPTEDPIRNCDVVQLQSGCNWLDMNGDPVFFENGESFGDLLDGTCGPASEFPSFCYVPPGSSGGDEFLIDYPYCIFKDTESEEDLCANDGETIQYVDNRGTQLKCTCSYTSTDGQNSTCETGPTVATKVPTAPTAPTAAPVNTPSGGSRRGIIFHGTLPFMFVLTSLTCCAIFFSML